MPSDTSPRNPAAGAPAGGLPLAWSRAHQRRLREVYRSAGWPCQDLIEIELLAAGLLERVRQASGHETLRVTDAGVSVLAQTLQLNRARRDPHEQLVERVAREMTRAGRLAWRGLSLRARVPLGGDLLMANPPAAQTVTAPFTFAVGEPAPRFGLLDEGGFGTTPSAEPGVWAMAMPDVFSVRHTTVEAYLEPVVHEIKVQRADLLADLKRQSKRAAYVQLSSQCWYVLREGIAEPQEIPLECGVIIATAGALEVARPAPRRAMRPSFDVWMALARATPVDGWRHEDAQARLGDTQGSDPDPSA